MCLGGNYKFVTECFFLTWRALHIGLLTAAETFLNTLSDLNKEIDRKGGEDKVLTELRGLYYFSGSCSLLDPQFVQMCGEFYITAAVWMTMLMESCNKVGSSQQSVQEEQVKILSKIPEVIIKDMMKWFHFVLRTRPNSLHGLQLTPMIDCCINLLNRPDLLPGPVAQTQIISVLLTCVSGNYNTNKLLSTDSWGGIHGELSAMVQGSPSFQGQLGPALLHTFSAVGVVEGLDVDKENFDKYTARYDMTQLLLYLWARLDCRESIVGLVGTKRFELFLQAIFDTLLYLLNDCFTRIANIQKMEIDLDKSDTSSSVPHFEKKRKEAFLAGEQRSAKGLINMSGNMLKLLEVTTEVDSVSKHFCVPPLSTRSASAIMGFLDVLCGARQTELKIKDPQKINFDPRKLVSQLATIMAHIWQVEKSNKLESTGFVLSLVNHPDYSYSIISKVASILDRHLLCTGDVVVAYKGLIEQLNKESGGPGDPLASAAALVGQAAVSSSPTVLLDWQREIDSVVIDNDSVSEMYTGALMDSIYDTADLQDSHLIGHKATDVSMDPRSPKLKAILRDIKQLQESLSLHPDSSIFIRQDEDRMDLVRVLITGPVDTPYSYGCFTFDIYYPSNYPVNPPLVLLATTGSGTIRFNPNLYADGKVCLSLLGTWHGGDSSEKWDPLQSNLLQVLVSIQGLILIPEPIYNEPGYEAMQGTPQGKVYSASFTLVCMH
jgi:ubiquitin-protein ligase